MRARASFDRQNHRGPDGGAALLERFREQMVSTARRYSAGPHDAEDAYQRAAEIVLARRPTGTEEELCRWVRTTVKHEALAIRRQQRRTAPAGDAAVVAAREPPGPDASERVERAERVRLGVQALSLLKPQELRCLVLRARGFSYREICEQTGFSYTKVNRCVTEGRRAFLDTVSNIETGLECRRLAPNLSALADGEADARQLGELRPHLKGCLACRARLREYRTVPSRVAALAPPALLAGGPGPVRGFLESVLGAAQDRAAALGERAHQAAEVISAQKAAAVAASAAALAGGGAVGADRLSQRPGGGEGPAAEVRKAAAQQARDTPPASPTPDPPILAPPVEQPATPTPTPAPDQTPAPAADPAPSAPPAPPPQPVNEFGPEPAPSAAASQPAPAPAPIPAPAPSPSGGGGGEFAP